MFPLTTDFWNTQKQPKAHKLKREIENNHMQVLAAPRISHTEESILPFISFAADAVPHHCDLVFLLMQIVAHSQIFI